MDSTLKIPCTLVPVRGSNLLLPNNAIAEVIVRGEVREQKNLPKWCLGQINWNGRGVLVIAFENIDVPFRQSSADKQIIVMLRNPEQNVKPEVFGVIAAHIPQVIQANAITVERNQQPEHAHSCALDHVFINGKIADIPDIAKVAAMIKKDCLA